MRSLEADESRSHKGSMPRWTLVATIAMVRASFPIFCNISEILPRYIATLVIYFSHSRGKHRKKWEKLQEYSIWNKDWTDPRMTLQEVMGYRVVPLIDSCFLGLTWKYSHCLSVTLHLSSLVYILKNILKLYFFPYTSISSLLFF